MFWISCIVVAIFTAFGSLIKQFACSHASSHLCTLIASNNSSSYIELKRQTVNAAAITAGTKGNKRMLETERRQSVDIGGEKLEIIATELGNQEWMLAVENSRGIQSIWFELFPSAHDAIRAGLKAIESEGIKAFASNAGYEYLSDG
jgi:hypothetical protein